MSADFLFLDADMFKVPRKTLSAPPPDSALHAISRGTEPHEPRDPNELPFDPQGWW